MGKKIFLSKEDKIVKKERQRSYMREYNRLYKFGIKKSSPTDNRYKDVVLTIPPTEINFKGNDIDEPLVCSEFNCGRHLTPVEALYNSKCPNCQSIKKTDPTFHLSYPNKRAG